MIPSSRARVLGLAAVFAALVAGCGRGTKSLSSPSTPTPTTQGPGPAPDAGTPAPGTWQLQASEDFENVQLGTPSWSPDPAPNDGPFSDNGLFFQNQGVVPPQAYRISQPFGQNGWLTIESYSRSSSTPFSSLVSVVPDPSNPGNHVLRIASPAHTDATVIRSTQPLPPRYRISLRVGFANFGDGLPGQNGYRNSETAEPWSSDSATTQNGFYWLTILDSMPRPHNNTWIHHHRKVVVDSDNNYPTWMQMWDGSQFIWSGEHPIMMFVLDGKSPGTELYGKPFIPYSAGQWQPSGTVRAVDAYLPNQWYQVSIERNNDVYTIEISGTFRYGGQQTYRASIDAKANCVWHFNQTPQDDASACVDNGYFPSLGSQYPFWPAGRTWPDYFMFGDPHNNYYEGSVLYDDVRLEVLP